MGTVVSVLSGKGGTGKSTAASALSCALCELGRRVVAVDLDAELRNLDLCLGLQDGALLDYGDVLDESVPLSRALLEVPGYPGLHLLTTPPVPRWEALPSLLQALRQQYDYVLLDHPAGLGPHVALAAQHADRALLVVTADPCSHRDGERAAQLLREQGGQELRMLINRVSRSLLRRGAATLDDSIDQVGVQLLGYVPEDARIPLALGTGKPLLQACPGRRGAAGAFRRIAKRIDGQKTPIR